MFLFLHSHTAATRGSPSLRHMRNNRTQWDALKERCGLLWCAKVYSLFLFLLYIQLLFEPTPSLAPTPKPAASPVTVTVTTANQSSPAERRQPNKEEQKKGYFEFLLLNSNKYMEMQWFLRRPFSPRANGSKEFSRYRSLL